MKTGARFLFQCLRVLQYDSHGTAFNPLCLGLLCEIRVSGGGGGGAGGAGDGEDLACLLGEKEKKKQHTHTCILGLYENLLI